MSSEITNSYLIYSYNVQQLQNQSTEGTDRESLFRTVD